jgi:hypothetical protein
MKDRHFIHEVFTDQEFEFLTKAKERNQKNWHDFILLLTQIDDSEWLLGRITEVKTK